MTVPGIHRPAVPLSSTERKSNFTPPQKPRHGFAAAITYAMLLTARQAVQAMRERLRDRPGVLLALLTPDEVFFGPSKSTGGFAVSSLCGH
jgi:hypothetical protein